MVDRVALGRDATPDTRRWRTVCGGLTRLRAWCGPPTPSEHCLRGVLLLQPSFDVAPEVGDLAGAELEALWALADVAPPPDRGGATPEVLGDLRGVPDLGCISHRSLHNLSLIHISEPT